MSQSPQTSHSEGDSKAADPPRPGSLSREDLRDAAVSGVRWVAVARFAGEALALVASVVLAHLITPAEFGRAAVALVLPILSVTLSFQGFGSVLVQRERLERAEEETAMFLSLAFGFSVAAGVYVSAPIWADPLFGARTADLMQLASPAFAIAGVGVVSRARLQRRLDFKRMSAIEVVGFITASVVSLGAAAVGFNAEALVLGAVMMTVAEAALMCAVERPPRPRMHRECVRGIASFGLAASLASLAWVARRNIDYVVLAARLPAAQVGIYWRALSLGATYQEKLSGVLTRLAFPLFSRTQDLEDIRLLRSRVVRTNLAVIAPLLATFIVVAPDLIPWVYGERWSPAIAPAQILAVGGLALAVMSGTEQLILALGRPRVLFVLNAASLLATALAVLIASSYGLTAVCLAVTGVHVVIVTLAQAGVLRRLVGTTLGQLAADVVPYFTASAAALLAGTFVEPWLSGIDSPLFRVAGLSTVCLATYALVLRGLFGGAWAEVARSARRVLLPGRTGPTTGQPSESSAG